jgi:hypothetical protein
MRVRWNDYEPPVPLDLGWDPEDEPVLEIYNSEAHLCTVRRTQITGFPDRSLDLNRVYLWLDGAMANGSTKDIVPELKIGNYLIYLNTWDEDATKQRPLRVTDCKLKGKSAAITVTI